jgi:hypothetical protein
MSSTTWIAYTMLALSSFIVVRSIVQIINNSKANKNLHKSIIKKLIFVVAATIVFIAVVSYLIVSK